MDESKHEPGKAKQMIATGIMNLAPFIIGLTSGLAASLSYDLQKENNELGIKPLTDEKASWLVSIESFGVLMAMLVGPSLCEALGRKKTGIIAAWIFITGCLIKLFTRNFIVLLTAQLVDGIGVGLTSLVIPLYITEMASDAIRGGLGSCFIFSLYGGYTFVFILTAILTYKLVIICILVISMMHLGGLLWLPETPIYLIRKNQIVGAKRSLMWFCGDDRTIAECKLGKLQQFHRKLLQSKSSLGIKDLFTDWVNLKCLLISLTLLLILHLSGKFIMIIYVLMIFDEAKVPVDSRLAGIIFLSVSTLGCVLSSITIDRLGRRTLLLLGTSLTVLSHTILGVFFTLSYSAFNLDGYGWIPIITIIFFGFIYCAGLGPITIVFCNEIYNPELAGICNSIWWASNTILAFILTKIYPSLVHTVGFHNCFFLFNAATVCGFFFVLFVIPETKGKSIEYIRNVLKTKRGKGTYNITEEEPMESTVISTSI